MCCLSGFRVEGILKQVGIIKLVGIKSAAKEHGLWQDIFFVDFGFGAFSDSGQYFVILFNQFLFMIDFIELLENYVDLWLSIGREGVKDMIAFLAKKRGFKHVEKFISFIVGLPKSKNSANY